MKIEKLREDDIHNIIVFYRGYFIEEIGYSVNKFYLDDLDKIHNIAIEKCKSSFSNLYKRLSNRIGWCGDEETTNKEIAHAFSLVPKFKEQLKQDIVPYLISKGYVVTFREAEQVDRQKAIDEWNSLSKFEQRRIINQSKKKPATLAQGWVIFIILLLVESIFYGAVGGWIATTILFLIWRRCEIDKYN